MLTILYAEPETWRPSVSLPHNTQRGSGTYLVLVDAYVVPVVEVRIDSQRPNGLEHDLARLVPVKGRTREVYGEVGVAQVLASL